ncbi:MAG: AraC family transcriptional regulator [Cytophagales bacterium]|nr:AraC family transcriptional regulator [Cytophagales bacterium]
MKEIELNATSPYSAWVDLKKSYEVEEQNDKCIRVPEKFVKGEFNFHCFTNDIFNYQLSCEPLQENRIKLINSDEDNRFMVLMLYYGTEGGLNFDCSKVKRIGIDQGTSTPKGQFVFHGYITCFDEPFEFQVKSRQKFKLNIFLIRKKWIKDINTNIHQLKDRFPVWVTAHSTHFKVGHSVMSYERIFSMLDEINAQGVDFKTLGQLYTLLGNYLNLITDSMYSDNNPYQSKISYTDLRLLVELENYLEANIYKKPVSLTEMSKAIGTSKTKMCQLFKTAKGTTIQRYLIALKMEKAKDLLSDKEKSITEVADNLRIANNSYFTRLFKNHTGFLPTEYREISA